MTTDVLTRLLQKLDEPIAYFSENEAYYEGRQPLAFLSPESRLALGNRFGRLASNLPRLLIGALTERLRITGFAGAEVWPDWIAGDLDQLAPLAHRDALLLGASFVVVWADRRGRPRVSVESAKQTAVLRDPGTREILYGLKRWETDTTTEAVLFGPDTVTRLSANHLGATTAGFEVVETLDNPFGIPPVVQLRNTGRILDTDGVSELDDLKPLVDALNKLLVDMMTTSEFVGRPRRWATGVELTERNVPVLDDDGRPVLDEEGDPVLIDKAINPIPEGNRAMIAEKPEAKFGQLAAADLAGYEAAVRVLLGQIEAVTNLPSHYLGQLSAASNPTSADALRASEAALTARAEALQAAFGRPWEAVARLMVAARTGADPATVDAQIRWADAATRSEAQEADAIVKLYSAGLLPRTAALERLGYSSDEITEIVALLATEGVAA